MTKNKMVTFAVNSSVGILTLNSPPGNRMDKAMFKALGKCMETIDTSKIKGLIVGGAGRHFSSGANLEELHRTLSAMTHDEAHEFLRENIDTFCTLEQLNIPVIAAIRGCCLGAGLELALCCHKRIAEKTALLSLPEATFDIMPGCGGTVRLTRLIGPSRALELLLSGENVMADHALEYGLVDRVVAKGCLINACMEEINAASTQKHGVHGENSAY